jgi:aspartyl-tRNA(Asn)/glutamyl-tRNA(Gln) amidotransferase subunit C
MGLRRGAPVHGRGRTIGTIAVMPVEIDIAKVANLARIALSEEELRTYGSQLEDILEHAERVQALPTEGVEPTSHPLPMVNGFRDDEVLPSLDRDSFLSQAPDSEDGQFRVPRIL